MFCSGFFILFVHYPQIMWNNGSDAAGVVVVTRERLWGHSTRPLSRASAVTNLREVVEPLFEVETSPSSSSESVLAGGVAIWRLPHEDPFRFLLNLGCIEWISSGG